MVRRKKIGMWTLALAVAALTSPLLIFSQNGKSQKMPNLELRFKPGVLVNGVPESFAFVCVNISDHDVRMPQPSNCYIASTGTIVLNEIGLPASEWRRGRLRWGHFRSPTNARSN